MVREAVVEGRKIYLREVCGLGYLERDTAEECEKFCRKHHACSLEITRKAVHFP